MTTLKPDRRLMLAGLLAPLAVGCSPGGPKSMATLPDDMVLGDRASRATIVEYASVGCPVCGRWAREVYPILKTRYIDTGRLRFTYREMLVGGGVELTSAAAGFVLARCAGQAKYFPIVDAIYRNQEQLFKVPRETLLAIARSCGMTEAEFDACMQNDKAFAALSARVERNSRADDVHATPTFVVNGHKLDAGFQPLEAIELALRTS